MLAVEIQTAFGAPWDVVWTTILVTAAIYASVFLATRVAGRRTLAEISAFDTLTTIAIGTMLGSTALSGDVSYSRGLAAILTLLVLQVIVGVVRRRFRIARRVLDFPPVTVVSHGTPHLPTGPLGAQLTEDELRSQIRHHGIASVAEVERAVLEPIGGVSVVGRRDAGRRGTREVIEHHVHCRRAGDLDTDLRENYSSDVVLLSHDGIDRGHPGVRRLASMHGLALPGADGTDLVVDGEVGLLRTSGSDGWRTDTFVVRNGLIVAQTVQRLPQPT